MKVIILKLIVLVLLTNCKSPSDEEQIQVLKERINLVEKERDSLIQIQQSQRKKADSLFLKSQIHAKKIKDSLRNRDL